jgi:hypothetical protein
MTFAHGYFGLSGFFWALPIIGSSVREPMLLLFNLKAPMLGYDWHSLGILNWIELGLEYEDASKLNCRGFRISKTQTRDI